MDTAVNGRRVQYSKNSPNPYLLPYHPRTFHSQFHFRPTYWLSLTILSPNILFPRQPPTSIFHHTAIFLLSTLHQTNQHGFIKNRGTNTTITIATEIISKATKLINRVNIVLRDVNGAFDKV